MAGEVEIGLPRMRYDITMPLFEGRVPIDGFQLQPIAPTMPMVFADMPKLRTGDFDLWELNLGYLLPALEAGWEFVTLPLFVKRKPVYPLIFVRADGGITTPSDINGKRVGSRTYSTGLTIWFRGLLGQYHGVDLQSLKWQLAGKDFFPLVNGAPDAGPLDGKKNPADWLLDGDVDVLITDVSDAKLFERLENEDRIRRLFPDYQAEDLRLVNETGIYTPAHAIVMSTRLDSEHPELAGELVAAFQEAKRLAEDDMLSDKGGFALIYQRERLKEQQAIWGDPFAYGIRANRSTIDHFVRYNVEQGLIRDRMSDHHIFARSSLDS
ncbi:MAG TPA: PhnD/SsuA/transferrin family substrate-binding protein [Chloroflexota bacterium]|jgi:4,5-dihydroxyphthalate decarboxylase|nr:PhnD/SsuA/transferrin family substrate-binding protein [Chloroflexota bacterium]